MIVAFTGAGISAESGISTFQKNPHIRDFLTREYATNHPNHYRKVISGMIQNMTNKKPNDAHIALAEYEIPIISMNIDNLHEQAGTQHLLKIHGRLPFEEEIPQCDKMYNAPVLYGDPAPNYQIALSVLDAMRPGDILLIIGCSGYTNFSAMLPAYAATRLIQIYRINDRASTKVRQFLEVHKDQIDSWENFIHNAPYDSEWLNNYM